MGNGISLNEPGASFIPLIGFDGDCFHAAFVAFAAFLTNPAFFVKIKYYFKRERKEESYTTSKHKVTYSKRRKKTNAFFILSGNNVSSEDAVLK